LEKTHEIKGQGISAFVTLKEGIVASDETKRGIEKPRGGKIGSIAKPDDVFFTSELPKTRSAKIMRRLLRDIAEGRVLGIPPRLADPTVVAKTQIPVRGRRIESLRLILFPGKGTEASMLPG